MRCEPLAEAVGRERARGRRRAGRAGRCVRAVLNGAAAGVRAELAASPSRTRSKSASPPTRMTSSVRPSRVATAQTMRRATRRERRNPPIGYGPAHERQRTPGSCRTRPTSSTSTRLHRRLLRRRPTRRDGSASPSAPPGTAAPRCDGTFTRRTCSRSARPSAATAREQGIDGPLFLGRDTHALSEPAARTIVEVLAAHGVDVVVDADDGFTPTPVISHAILTHNRGGGAGTADGIVVTPSHNPPEDGGFKYNPPHGGPADTDVTGWIAARGQRAARGRAARRRRARRTADAERHPPRLRDAPTSTTSPAVIDLDAIRDGGLRLGVDPLGGASVAYWQAIARAPRARPRDRQRPGRPDLPLRPARLGRQDPHGLLLAVRDGRACASWPTASTSRSPTTPTPTATGSSRRRAGLLNPNHHLAVCIAYLFGGARDWGARTSAIGKTLVSSVDHRPRRAPTSAAGCVEVPVGFKWFVDGLLDGTLGLRRRGERGRVVPAPRRRRRGRPTRTA